MCSEVKSFASSISVDLSQIVAFKKSQRVLGCGRRPRGVGWGGGGRCASADDFFVEDLF